MSDERTRQRERRRTKGPMLYRHKGTGRLYIRIGPAYCKSEGMEDHRMMVYQGLDGVRYVRHEKEWEEKFEVITNPESL